MDSSGGGGGPGGAPPSFMGDTCYDWRSEENAGKWRGLFVEPLQKVLIQVHPQFTAKDDALEYVESLLIRLLANLTSKPPLTVTDVEVSRFISFTNVKIAPVIFTKDCDIIIKRQDKRYRVHISWQSEQSNLALLRIEILIFADILGPMSS